MAWVLLSVVLAFMIFGSLTSYFAEPKSGKEDFSNQRSQLRLTFATRQIRSMAGPGGGSDESEQTVFKTVYNSVEKKAGLDPEAARLRLVAGGELNRAPDEAAMALLSKSDQPKDQAFAQAYDPKSDAALAGRSLASSHDLLERAAMAHAMKRADDKGPSPKIIEEPDALRITGVLGLAGLAFMAGFVTLTFGAVLLMTKKFKPVGYPMGSMAKADADRLALRMTVYLFLHLTVPMVAYLALKPFVDENAARAIGTLAFVTLVVVSLNVPVFGVKDTLRKVVGKVQNPFVLGLWGIGGFLANLPILLALTLFFQFLLRDLPPPSHPLTNELAGGANGVATLVLFYFLAAIAAPFIEELTFRGLLFPALGRFMGVASAAVLSGFLFAAIHPQGPVLWAGLAAIGVMASFLTYMTGSLVPAMVMHSVHNASVLTLAIVVLG
ncbi:MAG: CPBP family intramembrane metalloprotease [Fimbriimonadaceae bacterium]|nr:CPBP family intramembrane metalloprotease [Fimbriimonadaceae bacterium]QYK57545.1 MAG: CPBP family intramembrane metalloprotease [Fimbriimonadaceae bacterium]